jgi:hypothetical protein
MDLKKISFCDKDSYNVNSNKYKKYILERINYSNILKNQNFESYKNIYQKKLMINDYFVSEITRGNKYLLLLFKDNLNKNVCLLIDCKICKGYEYPRINFINYRFDEKLYNNTLFSCELLKTSNKWSLLITDIYNYCNKNMIYSTFLERLQKIYYILKNEYIQDDTLEICNLRIKEYKYKTTINEFNSKFGYYFIPDNPNIEKFKYKFKNAFKKSNNNPNPKLNQMSSNQMSSNQMPSNQMPSNQMSSNQMSSNQMSSNQMSSNQMSSNQMSSNQMSSNQRSNNISNKITLKITKGHMPGIYFLHARSSCDFETLGVARIVGLKTNHMIQELFKLDIPEKKVLCEYNSRFKKWVPLSISNKDISSMRDI